ncbi:hypothetical protein TWF679_003925 [Orbilia oligospora]|uniref:Uncharacterized protein n=1 Tax=Orbilia oligospora TaxID=2813651 RepID=A0A8H8VEF2_ORBOL|nr:hypothetical protein TWF679_003925 [Orbilia oligospora]
MYVLVGWCHGLLSKNPKNRSNRMPRSEKSWMDVYACISVAADQQVCALVLTLLSDPPCPPHSPRKCPPPSPPERLHCALKKGMGQGCRENLGPCNIMESACIIVSANNA